MRPKGNYLDRIQISLRFCIFTFVFCISIHAIAQTEWSKIGNGFNSCFQKLNKGHYGGMVYGILEFETKGKDRFSTSFSKDSAFLDIVPDLNEIYDVSFKNYTTKNSSIKLLYKTYAYANELVITIDKQDYQLSLIDGACIGNIKGMEYEYITTTEKEFLIITFSENVGLCATRCYTIPELYILKGSTLVFSIKEGSAG